MATETSSIDDMLFSGKTGTQPAAPEHQPEPEPIEPELDEPEVVEDEPEPEDVSRETQDEPEETPEKEPEVDDYGNPKGKSKTYTEDEVNERINKAIRDRLARAERSQPQPQQTQQQKPEFEYDAESSESWQQQLEGFVEQTFTKMTSRQQQQAQQHKEQEAQAEFETKFSQSMGKFPDFTEVVGNQPITDAMTVATRSMKDPAAFLYAASKRHPQELQRISQMADNVSQMVEIGRLEERMKKGKVSTSAPKPVSRSREDASMSMKTNKEPTIEDMIAQADEKRRTKLNARRGR